MQHTRTYREKIVSEISSRGELRAGREKSPTCAMWSLEVERFRKGFMRVHETFSPLEDSNNTTDGYTPSIQALLATAQSDIPLEKMYRPSGWLSMDLVVGDGDKQFP
jgi:hypothetical protein